MPSKLNVLTPLLAATFLAGSAFAAVPTTAQWATPTQTQPRTPERTPRADTVAYYQGDPLAGGRLLTTTSAAPQPGGGLLSNAPSGATYAVVTTPFGRRIVNLRDAQGGRGAGTGPDDAPGGPNGSRGAIPDAPPPGTPPQAPGDSRGPAGTGTPNVLAGALRGASRVTFYTADPLKGGRVTGTVQLSGGGEAATTQAARGAKFAVVERPGERLIVDLGAAPVSPAQPAPQPPQR